MFKHQIGLVFELLSRNNFYTKESKKSLKVSKEEIGWKSEKIRPCQILLLTELRINFLPDSFYSPCDNL